MAIDRKTLIPEKAMRRQKDLKHARILGIKQGSFSKV